MDLFASLEKRQQSTPFPNSEPMHFFLNNNGLLGEVPLFADFSKVSKPFDVNRANIIIQSLINKNTIETLFVETIRKDRRLGVERKKEDVIAEMKSSIESLPYLLDGEDKIFVPIFPRSINKIYSEDFFLLKEKNYSKLLTHFQAIVIDPFDVYGPELYNSYFTKLVKVKDYGNEAAFYDYDSYSAYIVNEEGRLETCICFFDKDLKHRNTNHMLERIIPSLDAYFENDKEKFVEALVKNKLISSSFLYKNKLEEHKAFKQIEKKM